MTVGMWGQMYLEALKNAQPKVYLGLQMKGELMQRALEMDTWAEQTFEETLAGLQARHPEPEGSIAKLQQRQMLAGMAREITLDAILPVSEDIQRANAGNGGYSDEDEIE